jgi:uncharacterized protein YegL
LQDIKIEDTIILVDASRSMLRKDFKPNRLTVALQTARNFIRSKLLIDPKDRISIISFGALTKKVCPFSYEESILLTSLKKIQISGKGLIHEGIAFSLQLLISEMRKIGGKIPRIFILSDDKLFDDSTKLKKLLQVSKGLGVIIDACQLGKTQDYKTSTLKLITQVTGGEYGFFNNSKAIINAGKAFASKKELKGDTDHFSGKKKAEIAPLVSEVALPLRRPTVLDIRLMMGTKDESQKKCQICHSMKSPLTGADFFSEGRYCPSCDRAMHLSCAAGWAKKTEYKQTVFRCPFCYFLLELPKSIVKLLKEEDKEPNGTEGFEESERFKKTTMIPIPESEVNQIDSSCSYCNNIFLGDHGVYKCENCGSYYHEPCLNKMYNEIEACRYCGAQIVINS